MPRKLRLALLVSVVLVAVPAGTVKAATRMPIGFYDDPSFRWSTTTTVNLSSARKANASIIHVLADWSQIAPTKPANALSGSDPAYHLSDLDALVRSAQAYDLQVLLTISETPKWANGGQTPNHPPTDLSNLTQFAQMLASRYNGTHSGFGTVSRFSVWNEPNLEQFLTPQYSGTTIVSPGIYAKLYMAAYAGIKKGNPKAQVAAGETSNRGHLKPTPGSDNVAPATFAHLLSEAAPTLPFDAWATHPYPASPGLGPTARVAYPNVGLSTMERFGTDLQKWFGRRVPIWITEYAEQTRPEFILGVTHTQQAADAKKALQLAAADPYVEMFIWFVFRDSTGGTGGTWFSGLESKSGAKKPSYAAFAATAKGIVGQSQFISAGQAFSVKLAVPFMTYHDAPGAKVGVTYKVYDGKKVALVGQPTATIGSDETITFPVNFHPSKGKGYTLDVVVNDKHGQTETHIVALLPTPAT